MLPPLPPPLLIEMTGMVAAAAPAAVCEAFDNVDTAAAAAEEIATGGRIGLHGECELAEAPLDEASGTPDPDE